MASNPPSRTTSPTTVQEQTVAAPATANATSDAASSQSAELPISQEQLDVMLQDVDGDLVFDNKKAMFGYIEASKYLVIPHDVETDKDRFPLSTKAATRLSKPDLTIKEIGQKDGIRKYLGGTPEGIAYRDRTSYLQFHDPTIPVKVALMNFHALRSAGEGDLNAFVGATLRARWIVLGAYSLLADDNSRTYSELRIVDPTNLTGDKTLDALDAALDVEALLEVDDALTAAFVAQAESKEIGLGWATRYAEAIWCASEHVVRVRGHHWKEEYKGLLTKYLTASYEGSFEWPAGLSYEMVFRTAIHPFGLRALPIMAAHFAIHGKLGNAGLIRLSGAPNGMAVVTTTCACLLAMSGEPWYGSFNKVYADQLKLLKKIEALVLDDKYGYHLAHNLYGRPAVQAVTIDGVEYTIDQMRAAGSVLASAAQGFVEAMKAAQEARVIQTFSFSNAMAMKKPSSSNPLGTIRIRELINAALESVTKAETLEAATKAALPDLAAVAPKGD